eukprot:gene2441-3011_t
MVNDTQDLCIFGRLALISISIQKEKDIEILEYIKGSTTIKVMNIRIYGQFKIPKGSMPDSVERLSISLFTKHEHGEDPTRFSNILEEGTIPSSVKHISIDHPIIKYNAKGLIPDTVTGLNLFNWSYTPGEVDILPPKIEKLSISSRDKYPQLGAFPPSITDLEITFSINNPILKGVLPESIKSLKLAGISCPLEIGSLPSKLKTFCVLSSFSPIDIIPMKGIIPESLTELSLQRAISHFNLDLIPKSSLAYLKICGLEKSPLRNYKFQSIYQEFPKGLLPPNLKSLDIAFCSISKLNSDDIHIPNNIQLLSQDFK